MNESLKRESLNLTSEFNSFLRKVIRHLCKCNYNLSKMNYLWELKRSQQPFTKTPLLVYQMGKVGSSSIVKSLKDINFDRPIYHVHFLSKERIIETEAERKTFFLTEKYPLLKRPWQNEFLLKQLEKTNGAKWKVVTLTREPVARNISAFFENLDVKKLDEIGSYEISSSYYNIPSTVIKINNLKVLEKLFIERVNHSSPEQFFEREIKGVLGVDVFASEFSQSKGYSILEGKNADILILRLEDLNLVVKDAFFDFLGIPDFKLTNTNIGVQKNYAFLYKEFKKHVDLEKDYLNKVYSSKYMQHFYTSEETEKFIKKWLKTI